MSPTRAPTLRTLSRGFDAPRRFWDDPDLAPPSRKEVPLTAWS